MKKILTITIIFILSIGAIFALDKGTIVGIISGGFSPVSDNLSVDVTAKYGKDTKGVLPVEVIDIVGSVGFTSNFKDKHFCDVLVGVGLNKDLSENWNGAVNWGFEAMMGTSCRFGFAVEGSCTYIINEDMGCLFKLRCSALSEKYFDVRPAIGFVYSF